MQIQLRFVVVLILHNYSRNIYCFTCLCLFLLDVTDFILVGARLDFFVFVGLEFHSFRLSIHILQ